MFNFMVVLRKLAAVQTTINTINKAIKFETIAKVCENLQTLFSKMNLKFPTKI